MKFTKQDSIVFFDYVTRNLTPNIWINFHFIRSNRSEYAVGVILVNQWFNRQKYLKSAIYQGGSLQIMLTTDKNEKGEISPEFMKVLQDFQRTKIQ